MSGGTLCEHCQHKITNMLDDLEETYNDNYLKEYPEAKAMLLIAMQDLKRSAIILQRVDWLLSGDDGIESFRKRILKDLEK